MKPLRTTGIFLICCGVICLIIAIERFQSAVLTARKVTEQLEGVEFDSVGIPLQTTVTGFAAVVFFVAGVRLLWESRGSKGKAEAMLRAPDNL